MATRSGMLRTLPEIRTAIRSVLYAAELVANSAASQLKSISEGEARNAKLDDVASLEVDLREQMGRLQRAVDGIEQAALILRDAIKHQ